MLADLDHEMLEKVVVRLICAVMTRDLLNHLILAPFNVLEVHYRVNWIETRSGPG